MKATVAFGKKYEHADSKVGVSLQQTVPFVSISGIATLEAIESVSTAATSPEVPDSGVSSEP